MNRPNKLNPFGNSNQNNIEELKKKLKEEQNNNKILHDIINKLKKEKNDIKNNLENEIKKLKEKIKILEKEIQDKNNEIQNCILKIQNINENKNQIVTNEIKEQNFKLLFNTQENQDIQNYKITCNNTDLFVRLEEKLYNEFPKYRNYQTYFKNNSSTILRFKTLEENQIQNNSKIFLLIDENK